MNHCSRYLCASAQIPTMLRAVVNESANGTFELVNVTNIQ